MISISHWGLHYGRKYLGHYGETPIYHYNDGEDDIGTEEIAVWPNKKGRDSFLSRWWYRRAA